jgi:hypothetical protein
MELIISRCSSEIFKAHLCGTGYGNNFGWRFFMHMLHISLQTTYIDMADKSMIATRQSMQIASSPNGKNSTKKRNIGLIALMTMPTMIITTSLRFKAIEYAVARLSIPSIFGGMFGWDTGIHCL